MSESSKKDTTDEAIRKILQSSFPKNNTSSDPAPAPTKRKVSSHAKSCNKPLQQQQQRIKLSRECHAPPPPQQQQQPQQQQYTVVEASIPVVAGYDMSGYSVVTPHMAQVTQPDPYTSTVQYPDYTQHHQQQQQQQQQHYDFSVSDSDRLVRALGIDFSEPVQRELSAK